MTQDENKKLMAAMEAASETRMEGPQGVSFSNLSPFVPLAKVKALLEAFVEEPKKTCRCQGSPSGLRGGA